MEWKKVPNVLFFWKDIMISPSLTDSLFLVTFKALFPLFLVMGGCAPEMCLYGARLEFELNVLRRIIKHLCCCVLPTLPDVSQRHCLIRARRLRSGLLADFLMAQTYWLYCTITSCLSFVLQCWTAIGQFFSQIPEELSGLLCFIFPAQSLRLYRINMAFKWNGQNI